MMYTITVGSHSISEISKKDLLIAIDYCWRKFYDKQWNNPNGYVYDVIKSIDETYFCEDFNMTRSEASKRLERIENKSLNSEPWLYAKFKLKWYIKYGPQFKNVEEQEIEQLSIEDFLGEDFSEGEEELL